MKLVDMVSKRCAIPVILGLMLGVAGCDKPEPADLVLTNGKIVTVVDANPEVQALAARGDRIVALGTSEEIARLIGPETEVIDLQGMLAVPGFIEGHGHFMGLGDARIQLDLRAAKSWQEIVDQVAAAAARSEPGAWIRGRGWHQDKWTAAPEPNVEGLPLHESLSAAAPENPVLLTHASGHALIANAAAMALAGVDATTPDPPGGEILRGPDGEPTGFFRETAQALIHAPRAKPPESELWRMMELASEESLKNGVTSFQDAGSSFDTVEFLRHAAEEGRLGVRLWMMVRDSNEAIRDQLASRKVTGAANHFFTLGGIKVSIDGALGSRGAWLLEPYSDSPESTGLNLVPMDEVRETAELAIENGVQLCIHAIGDRANREVLDLYEETFAAHPDKTDLRWRVEHAQHLHPDDIPRFAELGVIPSVQAIHCTSDASWVPDRLGEQRSEEGAYVWRKLIDSGAHVINGTDAPVESIDPIANYYASVSRRLADGSEFYPDQSMNRKEALESMTKNAAWGVFEEDLKGTLEVGKLADVVVLSRDVLRIPKDEIPGAEVLYTIVGGQVAYQAGE